MLEAIRDSARALLILTPHSYDREWITLEIGMALALCKMVFSASNYVKPEQMIEPVGQFNARLIETEKQRYDLIEALVDMTEGLGTWTADERFRSAGPRRTFAEKSFGPDQAMLLILRKFLAKKVLIAPLEALF